ncbi:hypothetical protein BSM4216_1290 [Bacillus smithii]|nr:hypothetical protein BSM4216_1290 [Bacillus smithii]
MEWMKGEMVTMPIFRELGEVVRSILLFSKNGFEKLSIL